MKAHAFGLSASRVPDDNSNPATEKLGLKDIVTSLSPETLRDCRARGAEVAVRSRCSAHGGDLAEVGHQGGEVTSGDT